MKKAPIVLLLLGSPAFALSNPTKTEEVCHEQAVLLEQTYVFFRQGSSETQAYDQQVGATASPKTKAWMKNMIHTVFSDSRSMSVDVSGTIFYYEQQCNHDPKTYVRDQALLK